MAPPEVGHLKSHATCNWIYKVSVWKHWISLMICMSSKNCLWNQFAQKPCYFWKAKFCIVCGFGFTPTFSWCLKKGWISICIHLKGADDILLEPYVWYSVEKLVNILFSLANAEVSISFYLVSGCALTVVKAADGRTFSPYHILFQIPNEIFPRWGYQSIAFY